MFLHKEGEINFNEREINVGITNDTLAQVHN